MADESDTGTFDMSEDGTWAIAIALMTTDDPTTRMQIVRESFHIPDDARTAVYPMEVVLGHLLSVLDTVAKYPGWRGRHEAFLQRLAKSILMKGHPADADPTD